MNRFLPLSRAGLVFATTALLALSACASSTDEDSSVATGASASASTSVSATASQSPTATSASSGASTSPTASVMVSPSPAIQEPTDDATTASPSSPAPTGSIITVPAPGRSGSSPAEATASQNPVAETATCNYSNIHIAAAASNGAAGSRYIALTYTNAGASPCKLAGWPTVTYVDAAGQTIGAPAAQAAEWTSSGEVVDPGGSVEATLRETRANLYGETCQPVTAAGYRVGIPGTDSALTLNFPAEACSNPAISQLSVGQVGATP